MGSRVLKGGWARIRGWRRRDLAERIAPYVQPIEPRESMVSADPIRMVLIRWMIDTGDSIEVVAKGFDLDEVKVSEILDGRIVRLSAENMTTLKGKLSLDCTDQSC